MALTACLRAQDQPAAFAVEEGLASWYGTSFDGLRAASGEVFDSGQFTAAHRTLPFGTKVRVRRLDSEESIVVRINDRGPFVESRIIDLSYAAARRLGVTAPGIVRVALEVVGVPDLVSQAFWFAVQVGTFRNPDNARRTQALMQQKFGDAVNVQRDGEFWRVMIGNVATRTDAETLAVAIRKTDLAYRSAYVVQAGASSYPLLGGDVRGLRRESCRAALSYCAGAAPESAISSGDVRIRVRILLIGPFVVRGSATARRIRTPGRQSRDLFSNHV